MTVPSNPNLRYHPNLKKLLSDRAFLTDVQHPNASKQLRLEYTRIRALFDFRFFVETFFAHYCDYPFSTMHEDFFLDEQDPFKRGRREAIAAPRGHAKTTFKLFFKVLHAIVYGYEHFILVIGHSAPEAEGKVRDISQELEKNKLLQEVYGHLAPIKGQSGWSTKNFVTQNNIRVTAKSRGKQVRGLKHEHYRPTLIILDDSEAPDKVLNEAQRYKTQQWLEKDILKLGSVDGKANIIMVGTCLHPEALLPTLLNTAGWQGRKYQAVLHFATEEALWVEWQKLYTDLTNPHREAESDAFYDAHKERMLAGTEVLWPEAETYLMLMKMRVNEGQASFQSEKQNDPYDPTRQLFDMQKAVRFKLEYEADGHTIVGMRWQDGSNRFVRYEDLVEIVAFHDPALAENKKSHYAAIVVCAQDHYGHLYCLDAYIEKVLPSRQIDQAFRMHQQWNLDKVCLETNHFQGILKEHYQDRQNENTSFRLKGVHQHQNKEARISALEPLITNGQLLFNETLSQRFFSQMALFPTSDDDGPDALHGAVSQLHRGLKFRG